MNFRIYFDVWTLFHIHAARQFKRTGPSLYSMLKTQLTRAIVDGALLETILEDAVSRIAPPLQADV